VVALVDLEVLREVVDLLGEERDLDLGGSRIACVLNFSMMPCFCSFVSVTVAISCK
jgi:hypothetical protein